MQMAGRTSTVSGFAAGARAGVWRGVGWAWSADVRVGLAALAATLRHATPLRRWMAVVHDLRRRGLVDDVQREYLRALRPFVHRHTDVPMRVRQLIDHHDWMEAAFEPHAFERVARGDTLVLAELPPPRGFDWMRLQLQRSPRHSPEGELLLVLAMRRSPDVQPSPPVFEVAALAFTRIRIDGQPCLAIGGVRGQRDPHVRLSATEITQALHGWKAPVYMVRVAQELARHWGLNLVGLDPAAHFLQSWDRRWRRSHREAAQRIFASHAALWEHFGARKGPAGWMVLPLHSDEKLEAVALSPEKRVRQIRRADFWIRTRQLLRMSFRSQLVRHAPEDARGAVTRNLGPRTVASEASEWDDFQDSEAIVPSRSLETGPAALE